MDYNNRPIDPGKNFNIASMVLGICSLVLVWFIYLSLPAAIVGLILGVMGKKRSRLAGFPTGIATAGIVMTIIALAVLVLIFGIFGIALAMFSIY